MPSRIMLPSRAFATGAAVAAAVLIAAGVVPLLARQSPAPVLTPAEALKTFALPEGYRIELVANEPLVSDPVLIEWDADGRLWVVEMPSYMIDIRGSDEHTPNGRIAVLEDTDGDGRMDRRSVFADGLVLPRALKVLDSGVLVGEPPVLWLMQDTDGDGRADRRTEVTRAYGTRDANVEHNANGLLWAMDNRLYTSEVAMFVRWKDRAFAEERTISRGQWGLSQDDAGRVYRNTNSSVLHVDLVPTPYYTRTKGLVRTRGSYESLANGDNQLNATFPARPTPGVNRGYQFGVLRPDGRLATFTGAAAPTVFRGDRLPADVYGNVFVAEPAGNLVARVIVAADDTGVTARRAYPDSEFLTSTDERFRPVYLSSAPDGTLYVVDMYRGIIQHRGYITEYLRDQILSRGLEQPIGLGRIYRIVHDTTVRGPAPSLSTVDTATLVKTLSHPNGWWRDTAQRLLVERGDRRAAAALVELARSAPEARTRLHALWTLDGLGALDAALVVNALADPSADVRVSALRLAESFLSAGHADISRAVTARMTDTSQLVRRQLAATVGELPPGGREPVIADVLVTLGGDPIVADAALSGMRDGGPAVLARLLESPADTALGRQAVALVAATLLRAGDEAPAQHVLSLIADAARPEWQRAALVTGAEVALLNATVPGSPAPRGGGPAPNVPCPTCPGGRAGPGGAPAFPPPGAGRASGAATASGGGNDGPRLSLAARPALADAAIGGPLGERVARVLDRVAWPGKPSVSTAAALTREEQRLFESGREVYSGLCQACHQADGRGLDTVAPPLVGSALALGPADRPIRVLLHGKEGSIGLMPPLGATMTDEAIAASLTYVRRSWGHTAAPVAPADVGRVRAATAGRTRPWTPAELAQ